MISTKAKEIERMRSALLEACPELKKARFSLFWWPAVLPGGLGFCQVPDVS